MLNQAVGVRAVAMLAREAAAAWMPCVAAVTAASSAAPLALAASAAAAAVWREVTEADRVLTAAVRASVAADMVSILSRMERRRRVISRAS